MAIRTGNTVKVPALGIIANGSRFLIIFVLIALLTACGQIGKRSEATVAHTAADTKIEWVKQKAKETGGDMTKLSQEDQQRLVSIYPQNPAGALRHFASQP
jgi:hypothetical protein